MGLTEQPDMKQINKDMERSKREAVLLEKRSILSLLQLKIKLLVDEVVQNDIEIKNLQGEIKKSTDSKCREETKYAEEMGKFNELLKENANKRMKEEETVQKLTDIQTRCQMFTNNINELKKTVDAEKVDYENQMNTYKVDISELSSQLEDQMEKFQTSKSLSYDTINADDVSTLSGIVYLIHEEDINDLEKKLANVDARIHEELEAKVKCNEKLDRLKERANQFNSNLVQNMERDVMSCKSVVNTQIFTVEDQISELNTKAKLWRLEKAKLEKQCSVVRVEQKRKEEEIRKLRDTLEELETQVSLKQARSCSIKKRLEEREREIENLTKKEEKRSSALGNVEMDLLKLQASAMCNDVTMAKDRLRALRNSIGAENRRVCLAEEKLQAQNKETCSNESVGGTQRAEKEHDPVYTAKMLDLNQMAALKRSQAMEINEMCKNELLKEKKQLEDNIQQLEQQNKKLKDLSEKETNIINETLEDFKTSAEKENVIQSNVNKVLKEEHQLKSASQRRLAEIMEERRQGLYGLGLNTAKNLSLKDLQTPVGANRGLHQALSSAKEELRILQEVKSQLPEEVSSLQEKCEQLKCQYKARMELLKNRIQELREKSKHNLLQEEDVIETCSSICPTTVAKLREKWDNFAKSFSQDEKQ